MCEDQSGIFDSELSWNEEFTLEVYIVDDYSNSLRKRKW